MDDFEIIETAVSALASIGDSCEAPLAVNARVALARLRDDPNLLPIDEIPEGWEFQALLREDDGWTARLEWNGPSSDDRPEHRSGEGSTPRAAMFEAIERIGK